MLLSALGRLPCSKVACRSLHSISKNEQWLTCWPSIEAHTRGFCGAVVLYAGAPPARQVVSDMSSTQAITAKAPMAADRIATLCLSCPVLHRSRDQRDVVAVHVRGSNACGCSILHHLTACPRVCLTPFVGWTAGLLLASCHAFVHVQVAVQQVAQDVPQHAQVYIRTDVQGIDSRLAAASCSAAGTWWPASIQGTRADQIRVITPIPLLGLGL
jgi:hypothetical protein